ncbi:MAG: FadR/GntR family transcriptional regulator [Sphingomonas sp.]
MLRTPSDIRQSLGRNLTHGLLDTLGKAIVTGEFDGKQFPTEKQLAEYHGVSHTVTREAVKMLTAKGLLSARPRQGTIIQAQNSWNLFDPDVLRWLLDRKFSVDLLRQFSELRIAVEPTAAALAASASDDEGLAAIGASYARMVAAERGEDDALEADIAFHVAILEASSNPFFVQFRDVVDTALRSSIRFTNRVKGRTADLERHGDVFHAIRARDPERARHAMFALISKVLETTR